MQELISKIKNYAREKEIKLYMVGGAVRDKYLNRDISDYDFTMSRDCHEFALGIAEVLGGSYVNMHQDVARVVVDGCVFDFSNFKGQSILEDLSRRDFAINSMAIDMDDENLEDPLGGLADINDRVLRMTYGDTFRDDPLRMLRAVRLCNQTGFEISKATMECIIESAAGLSGVPGERVQEELYKILRQNDSHKYFKLLDELGLLEIIFPVMKEMKGVGKCSYHAVDAFTHSILTLKYFEHMILRISSEKYLDKIEDHLNRDMNGKPRICIMKLAAFLHDIGKPRAYSFDGERVSFKGHEITGLEELAAISGILALPGSHRQIIGSVIGGHMRILGLFKQGISKRSLFRFFRDYGEYTIDVLLCSLADVTATRSIMDENNEKEEYYKFILGLIHEYFNWQKSSLKLVSGRDVIEITGAVGSRIGEILDKVDEEVFYGNIKTREEALGFIREKYKK